MTTGQNTSTMVQANLPPNTVIPTQEDLWNPYFTNLYNDIATTVNAKDGSFYPMAITSTAQNILNLPGFGAFLICVSGVQSTLPTGTWSLCKADSTAAGSIATIGAQVGTGDWAGNALTITATATNFQIAHDRTGVSGNFNLRVIGTQSVV